MPWKNGSSGSIGESPSGLVSPRCLGAFFSSLLGFTKTDAGARSLSNGSAARRGRSSGNGAVVIPTGALFFSEIVIGRCGAAIMGAGAGGKGEGIGAGSGACGGG